MKNNYTMIHLSDYQSFEHVHDMDITVNTYAKELTKSIYETLRTLSQYSLQVIGVSHIKIKTIADRLNKSERTIKRHIKYLKENGYISVVNLFRRVAGGKGASAYIINPIDIREKLIAKFKNVTSKMSRRNDTKKDGQTLGAQAMAFVLTKKQSINSLNLYKLLSNKRKNKRTHLINRENNIKAFRECPECIDKETYKRFKMYFSDAELVTIVKSINKQLEAYVLTESERIEITHDSIKALIVALKKSYNGKADPIKSLGGYVSGITNKKAFQYVSERMFADIIPL
ncbi:hypothetical protein BHU61_13295 (plasmid) [Macrococcus epidermidis]|uniref:Uncharacterized protein n=1 Tax=Macrococcus epidermidis TaxID=1902580 RepID=A0A327ZM92_9STAP|nr:HTH domain-containing protein [Macrococcus epidermidis]RAK43567.1 hypothetical protein BHU61_13295 [Macrococcus epidermidis]